MCIFISFSHKTSSNEEIFLVDYFVFLQSQKKLKVDTFFFFSSVRIFSQVCRLRETQCNIIETFLCSDGFDQFPAL